MSSRLRRELAPGLYDQPLTRALSADLTTVEALRRVIGDLDEQRAPLALGRVLRDHIQAALASIGGEDRIGRQLAVANRLLEVLREELPDAGLDADDAFDAPARLLLAILEHVDAPAKPRHPTRPQIPLSTSDLLVNGRHDLSLGPELQRELESADRVDLLCSFLKWSGLRIVEDQLRDLVRRRGPASVRVLTTAYMAATERHALDVLTEMGIDVRVSYDTARTRLHAKAWLFHRESGFSTGYVGSSNLSAAAILDGAEWNVRLTAKDNAGILDKFASTFEQYWNDPTFRPYVVAEFDEAVQRTKRDELAPYLFLDVAPRPHQAEILDDLAAERQRGHHRNLVVAATGTGKTIVAALDYKRLRKELPRARLLFVAHRKEILEQSVRTFRVVLHDGAFGELLVGGKPADRWEHVFASIQSLHEEQLARFTAEHFDVVIVDEFHHAAADTYRALLSKVQPKFLLGLTATPERADGGDILGWFEGRVASELRLWKALDQGLLAPFQYFGIGGAPDASGVKWSRGRYDVSALSNVYTADHLFARRVLQELHKKVTDVSRMRALGFCIDVAHAEFMAAQFEKAGIASAAVSAATPATERAQRLSALRAGDLRCVFSVDLFNEGVDLPDVDTVIFLRPTESATLFLQQLGRGLRRSDNKECLTVLDFIGDAHRKFRFDLRYRAIVGGTRKSVQREIEHGFPSLPSGCVIQLDAISSRTVLDNIRSQLGTGMTGLVEDLQALVRTKGPSVDLATFLAEAGLEPDDLYVNDRSWTALRRAAGVPVAAPGPDDTQIERALSRMLHIDDPLRLEGLRSFVQQAKAPRANDRDPIQRLLFALLGYVRRPYTEMPAAWDALWSSAVRDELAQLLGVLDDRTRRVTVPLSGPLAALPLQVHGTYSLDEVLASVDERTTKGGVKRIQTGVFRSEPLRSDLLFVTLEKNEKEYSPTTLYKDYAICPTRFHWETQSNCHDGTETGQRYLRAAPGRDEHVLLFVRARRRDARGETMPYACLGEVFHHAHRGARPMQIEWELAVPMPAAFYQETKVAAG